MVGLEDLPLALAGSSPDEMKLLLAHNPVILRRAARAGVDLVFSGHTHGGQVTWRSERSASGRLRRRLLKAWAARARRRFTSRAASAQSSCPSATAACRKSLCSSCGVLTSLEFRVWISD